MISFKKAFLIIIIIGIIASVIYFMLAQPTPTYPHYLGCYKDKSDRALSTRYGSGRTTSLNDCYNVAKDAESQYFGLQFYNNNPINGGSECWHGAEGYDKYGSANNCTAQPGYQVGAGFSNAVYQTY